VEKGRKILKEQIEQCKTPIELTVKLAREVCQNDANPQAVLGHLMAQGILEEEGCKTMFREIHRAIEEVAPELAMIYENMVREQRNGVKNWGVIDPRDLE
jgi:hypothetical protein